MAQDVNHQLGTFIGLVQRIPGVDLTTLGILPLSHANSVDPALDWLLVGPGDPPKSTQAVQILDSRNGTIETLQSDLLVVGPHQAIYLPRRSELTSGGLRGLQRVVAALLEPETGCPWDLEQTHESLRPFLLEEAHELNEAIESKDWKAIQEELGDVLLQPMMHSRMAAKEERFDLEAVANSTAEKLIRRHPHVFGDSKFETPEAVLQNWEQVKKAERGEKQSKKSMLDGVPKSLPALSRAMAISQRVARVGFEWPSLEAVHKKLDEELAEFKQASLQANEEEISKEWADLVFTMVQVARWRGFDPEWALQVMLARFKQRFERIEQGAEKPLPDLTPEEWDVNWQKAKAEEK